MSFVTALRLFAVSLLLVGGPAMAFNMPPANSYLADSNYSMAHADPAQQDALPQAGPNGPSRTLSPAATTIVGFIPT